MSSRPEKPAALVLLNPAARGGRSRHLYQQVSDTVNTTLDCRIVEMDLQGAWRAVLREALEQNIRIFLAAGGDGTVRELVETLTLTRGHIPAKSITIGGARR